MPRTHSNVIFVFPESWSLEYHMKLLKGEIGSEDLFDGKPLQLPDWFDEDKFKRYQINFMISIVKYHSIRNSSVVGSSSEFALVLYSSVGTVVIHSIYKPEYTESEP